MKLLVSLSSLLLALCLGSGAAGPLQGPGTGAGQGMGEATGNGVEKAIGEGAKEAVSSGIEDAVGQGNGGEASSAFREATGDALSNKLGEAAHALENTGREAGRQAESFIRHGTDAAHSSASWGTSGGHGVFGSHGSTGGQGQGSFGGPGSPWGHGQPGGSEGSFGTNSLGGSWGQGGSGRTLNLETNAQCANGPLSGSGGSSTNSRCDYPQNEGRITGESESEGHSPSGDSNGDEGVNELNSVNSQTSPGVFNFDNFWKNFKSKLGFINWDAINKGQVLSPSTRALLYFRRLWEDFKRRTPFFNWKKITEDLDLPPLQKRAGSSDQVYYNQQAYPTMSSGQNSVRSTPKEEATVANYARGSEAFNNQFLNIGKWKNNFNPDEFLNWHALMEVLSLVHGMDEYILLPE
ncbi:Dermokine [Fukomys damarensis]|uniref:Dermokine n=1 Tax=Fukomys damarensis TaxID=885580 RepID=A0A091EAU0_FUKDA|nr:Dermokine [Fukomys damarensis]